MTAFSLMLTGTTFQAGTTTILTGLCRYLSKQGHSVAPFQAQNFTTRVYTTPQGLQLGYDQALQAWAAGIAPRLEHNPVLLYQQDHHSFEFILGGTSQQKMNLEDYREVSLVQSDRLITLALERIKSDYEILLCEGLGNPADPFIPGFELGTVGLSLTLQCPLVLVADVSLGGAFTQITGTLASLDPQVRSLLRGIILNKHTSSAEALKSRIEWLEQHTQIPVLGSIPWLSSLEEREDDLGLLHRSAVAAELSTTIAVIRLPNIASFTEFDALDIEPTVKLRYVTLEDSLGYPDAVILPSSRTIIADLIALYRSPLCAELKQYVEGGGTIVGICGGFQMLGEVLTDPDGLEGAEGRFPGLGFLPIRTVYTGRQVRTMRQVNTLHPQVGLPIDGYEVQRGHTQVQQHQKSFQSLFDDEELGLVGGSTGDRLSVWGCHLHGLFENGSWRRMWLNRLRQQRGLKALPTGIGNYRFQRDSILDQLADMAQNYVDLTRLLEGFL
ncbi:MAG: cobyric acid synthase [Prochlorotrichaceae cyanobacterium]|jgi:adenosylcobyric acid synthase